MRPMFCFRCFFWWFWESCTKHTLVPHGYETWSIHGPPLLPHGHIGPIPKWALRTHRLNWSPVIINLSECVRPHGLREVKMGLEQRFTREHVTWQRLMKRCCWHVPAAGLGIFILSLLLSTRPRHRDSCLFEHIVQCLQLFKLLIISLLLFTFVISGFP